MLQTSDAPSNYPWTSKNTGKYQYPMNTGLVIHLFSIFITQPNKEPGKNKGSD